MFDKLKSVEKRFNDLNNFLSDPKVIAQQSDFQKYAREQAELSPIVLRFKEWQKISRQLIETKNILEEEQDQELVQMAQEDLAELEMQKDPALRKKVFEVTNLIIDSDKLENYGTARTHYHFKKWAKELAPDQNRTPKRIPDSDDAPKKRGQ